MLKKLILTKFRCYESHEVNFQALTVIVGKNNAGKSTLIEALRLLALVFKKFKSSKYVQPPPWLPEEDRIGLGIIPSLKQLELTFKNIIYRYQSPPATIQAHFDNEVKIIIYLNDEGDIFAKFDAPGKVIKTTAQAKSLFEQLFDISILPQISPLLEDESIREEDYVKGNLASSLSSRHFRNQLYYLNSYYKTFETLAAQTWEGLQITEFRKPLIGEPNKLLQLLVRENGYVAEIGFMGHGLQMWLQTIWFLARTSNECMVVLDEPDVYMHADLQRRLIRLLKNNYKQVIIATHSLEIMAEVQPENILVLDRSKGESEVVTNYPAIQDIIYNQIGSIHNLQLARLWSCRKILMVEGLEIKWLKQVQDKIFPKSNEPLDNIPNFQIGGFTGFNKVMGAQMLIKYAIDKNIKLYCILDSDYFPLPRLNEEYKNAEKHKIQLHIWKRKEIENYFILPNVILRLIQNKAKHEKPTLMQLESMIGDFCENNKVDLTDNFATQITKYFEKKPQLEDFTDNNSTCEKTTKNANRIARKIVNNSWLQPTHLVSGKELLKEINRWAQKEFKVNFKIDEIIQEMRVDEIPLEMKEVIEKIDLCQEFEARKF